MPLPPTSGKAAEGLSRAQPFIAALAGDPSLRGVLQALSFGLIGDRRAGKIRIDKLPGLSRSPTGP